MNKGLTEKDEIFWVYMKMIAISLQYQKHKEIFPDHHSANLVGLLDAEFMDV